MGNKKLLSIVVPTKDRYEYLEKLIELIDSFQYDLSKFELVIQDNTADNSRIQKYLSEHSYAFIKYVHKADSIPIYLNSDLAILASSGEYVCFIGDDDGILSTIIKVVEYMRENNIEALLTSKVIYDWPITDENTCGYNGTLQYRKGSRNYFQIDTLKELEKCVSSGLRDMQKLPKVYQGIVKREILDKIYLKTGSYHPGPSPDMSNAAALAILSPVTFYFDAPLIISGQSKYVGGGERMLKRNNLPKIEDVPFLPTNIERIWDRRLPHYWCADTIWPQSFISAFLAMGANLPKINFNQIIAVFIIDHPNYLFRCRKYISNYCEFSFYMIKLSAIKIFRHFYWRISYIISGGVNRAGVKIKRNIEDISKAVEYLEEIER